MRPVYVAILVGLGASCATTTETERFETTKIRQERVDLAPTTAPAVSIDEGVSRLRVLARLDATCRERTQLIFERDKVVTTRVRHRWPLLWMPNLHYTGEHTYSTSDPTDAVIALTVAGALALADHYASKERRVRAEPVVKETEPVLTSSCGNFPIVHRPVHAWWLIDGPSAYLGPPRTSPAGATLHLAAHWLPMALVHERVVTDEEGAAVFEVPPSWRPPTLLGADVVGD